MCIMGHRKPYCMGCGRGMTPCTTRAGWQCLFCRLEVGVMAIERARVEPDPDMPEDTAVNHLGVGDALGLLGVFLVLALWVSKPRMVVRAMPPELMPLWLAWHGWEPDVRASNAFIESWKLWRRRLAEAGIR